MNIKKEELEKEIEQWKNYYKNYNNLAVQVLVDILAFYKEEDRKDLIDKANEFLKNVNEPISGELMVDTIKGDVESFDRVSEEAAVAIRTLTWVKGIEDRDIEEKSEENISLKDIDKEKDSDI